MVYPALLVLYTFSTGITAQYFLGLLQRSDWQIREYCHTLSLENLRWLPVIFSLVPAAALLMDYGLVANLLSAGYLLAAGLFYWPWPGRDRTQWIGQVKRLFVLWMILWLMILLPFLAISGMRGDALVVVACILYLVLPLAPMVLLQIDRPLSHLAGRQFIRRSEGMLSDHGELRIVAVTGSVEAAVLMDALLRLLQAQYRCEMASRTIRTAMDAAQIIRDIEDSTLEYLLCRIDAGGMEEMKAILDTLHPEITVQASADYFDLVEPQTTDETRGIRFINGDDPVLRRFIGTERALTYGLQSENDLTGEIERLDAEGTLFHISGSGQMPLSFRTRLLGKNNITELTGAICVAYTLGIPEDKIRRQIRTLQPIPHRLELTSLRGMLRIDDSANEEELGGEEALDVLRQFNGVRILITEGFLRLGVIQEEANRRFGASAAQICDHIFLVGDEVAYGLRVGILEAGFRPEHLHETASIEEVRALIDEIKTEGRMIILLEYQEEKEKPPKQPEKPE